MSESLEIRTADLKLVDQASFWYRPCDVDAFYDETSPEDEWEERRSTERHALESALMASMYAHWKFSEPGHVVWVSGHGTCEPRVRPFSRSHISSLRHQVPLLTQPAFSNDAVILDRHEYAQLKSRIAVLEAAIETKRDSVTAGEIEGGTRAKVSDRIGSCFWGVNKITAEIFGPDYQSSIEKDDSAESGWKIGVTVPPSITNFSGLQRTWIKRILKDFSELLPGDVSLDIKRDE